MDATLAVIQPDSSPLHDINMRRAISEETEGAGSHLLYSVLRFAPWPLCVALVYDGALAWLLQRIVRAAEGGEHALLHGVRAYGVASARALDEGVTDLRLLSLVQDLPSYCKC